MAKAKKQTVRKASAPRTASDIAKIADKGVRDVEAIIAQVTALGLGNLTEDARTHSTGKLRADEDAAMVNVLDAVDAYPDRFAAIAAHDHGADDALVETAPARDALARRAAAAPLAAALARAAVLLGDVVLEAGATAKDVTVPAYAIITANAKVDPALRKAASKALDYYSRSAQKAARTKAKKKAGGAGGTPA